MHAVGAKAKDKMNLYRSLSICIFISAKYDLEIKLTLVVFKFKIVGVLDFMFLKE